MEELRLSLLIFGGCAILGILAHGLWSIRKNSKNKEQNKYSESSDIHADNGDGMESDHVQDDWHASEPHFSVDDPLEQVSGEERYDELGIGQVRVVSQTEPEDEVVVDAEPVTTPEDDHSEVADSEEDVEPAQQDAAETDVEAPQAEPVRKYASVVTQPKPELTTPARNVPATDAADGDSIPEPPEFLLKQSEEQPAKQPHPEPLTLTQQPSVEKTKVEQPQPKAEEAKPGLAEQARKLVQRSKSKPASSRKKRTEPAIREDQMRIDFDEPMDEPFGNITSDDLEPEPSIGKQSSGSNQKTAQQGKGRPVKEQQPMAQEVLVLNVKCADDSPIRGAALLPMLLTLGFKFGEQDIFHRHVNSNGKGPVLFSLANMFKPGVFDIDNMENFETKGISLFMILPIEGDPHQVFNMMHNAARKIADEFSAQVLDGTRSVLTKQSLQQYVEKIREFERQRMLRR